MRLIRSSSKRLIFLLDKREKDLLLAVLNFYPCLPPAHQPLSKAAAAPEPEAGQKLLDEALAEHRAENKARLAALLKDSKRLAETEQGWKLLLAPGDFEWLLQVLNDIRVGSWVRLGSPAGRVQTVTERTAPHYWAMEMAGTFQMAFLAEAG